jgi:hypothetical protein
MKKNLIVLLLVISVFSVSAQKTIFKINYTYNIVGLDLGYVNDKSVYKCIEVTPILYTRLPSYFNYGCGYMFHSHFYTMGLIGISDSITDQSDKTYSTFDYFNIGTELGFMYKDFVIAGFYTNTVGLGVKLGYAFKLE